MQNPNYSKKTNHSSPGLENHTELGAKSSPVKLMNLYLRSFFYIYETAAKYLVEICDKIATLPSGEIFDIAFSKFNEAYSEIQRDRESCNRTPSKIDQLIENSITFYTKVTILSLNI